MTISVLTIALMNNPTNTRIFERADGLLAISALYREPETTTAVKRSVMEFIYFYLLPEEIHDGLDTNTGTMRRVRSSGSGKSTGTSQAAWGDTTISEIDERSEVKGVNEKQKLLGKYFGGISGLPQQFETMNIYEGLTSR
jgi:hypothetical protein